MGTDRRLRKNRIDNGDGHYYGDPDTGEYTGICCSCGHADPYLPSEDTDWPGRVHDPSDPDNQPPF